MDKITKITGVYPIQLTHTTGPEVHIACQGEEISRALNELRERVYILESQVNDLTKSHNELQANYWDTELRLEDTLSKININLRTVLQSWSRCIARVQSLSIPCRCSRSA